MDSKLFPEYGSLSDDRLNKRLYTDPESVSINDRPDNLMSVIFAPDPETGLPRSDLAYVKSTDKNPEVAQYVRDNLLQSHESGGTLDVDEALATVKTKSMSETDYKNQLLRYIDKKQRSKK